ncbi:hypothetical protein ACIOZM_00110, partial [Pseudomonas sp. NPDC087346]|uniref:hypothetical protein n=1 Tax=Pseudomonas sp. NPDC087346 TaxID=3364438 RepID=UPI00380971C7
VRTEKPVGAGLPAIKAAQSPTGIVGTTEKPVGAGLPAMKAAQSPTGIVGATENLWELACQRLRRRNL